MHPSIYRFEQLLCLRKSISAVSLWRAKADTLVLDKHNYPEFKAKVRELAFNCNGLKSRFFWRSMVNREDYSVISFAVEHEQKSGEKSANQLAYDLSTALSHRLALGLPDAKLYGATCDDGSFTLYEAEWYGARTVIYFFLPL
jgi:hypothetical protein